MESVNTNENVQPRDHPLKSLWMASQPKQSGQSGIFLHFVLGDRPNCDSVVLQAKEEKIVIMRYGGRDFRRRDRGRLNDGSGGADHLARIHGTELDRVNCPFYFKIGACRHGDRCDRVHNKPPFSQTILIPQMYQNPLAQLTEGSKVPKRSSEQSSDPDFDEFFVDIFEELSKFGEIQDIAVCDNLCDHLLGAVYVQFYDEEDAGKCLEGIKGRYYAGKLLAPEFSPVTDFFQSRCRQYDRDSYNGCNRGGNCNYMHIKRMSKRLNYDLYADQPHAGERSRRRRRGRTRSRSRSRSKSR